MSQIPKDHLMCATALLILRAQWGVSYRWGAKIEQLPFALFLKVSGYRSNQAESKLCKPQKYTGGLNSLTKPKFGSRHHKLMSPPKLASGCLEPFPSHRITSFYILFYLIFYPQLGLRLLEDIVWIFFSCLLIIPTLANCHLWRKAACDVSLSQITYDLSLES